MSNTSECIQFLPSFSNCGFLETPNGFVYAIKTLCKSHKMLTKA